MAPPGDPRLHGTIDPMPSLPTTLGEALSLATGRIDPLDARVLLREAASCSAASVVAFPERALAPEAAQRYCDWLARREAGTPVAYLVGYREFFSRDFRVTPATLIPRPETELLVEVALEKMRELAAPRIVDLGTGSGAIAVTLALERPDAIVTAVDCAEDALAVAAENAERLGARVRLRFGSWYEALTGARFDFIVSNPPYVAVGDPHLGQGDLRFEPPGALASGSDGLDDIRRIVAGAPHHLEAGGYLMLEHGYDQAEAVRGLLHAADFIEVGSYADLAGIARVTLGCWPGGPD